MRIGLLESLVIFAGVLLLFGPKQIPKLAKTCGEAIRSFKDGVVDGHDDTVIEDTVCSDGVSDVEIER